MSKGRLAVAVAAVLLLLVGLAVMVLRGKSQPTHGQDESAAADTGETSDEPPANSAKVIASQATAGEADPAAADNRERRKVRKFADNEAREKLVRALAAARTRRLASDEQPIDEESGSLDAESIRASVQEILPLLAECYDMARETTPGLAGTAKVRFVITGEPEVGGIVEEAEFMEESEFSKHPVFSECLTETVMALELPAPENGGKVEVHYPLKFRPGR